MTTQIAVSGDWTTDDWLVVLNGILAIAATVTTIVGIKTIKSSNRVASSAESQAAAMIRPIIVNVPANFEIDPNADLAVGTAKWSCGSYGDCRNLAIDVLVRNIGSGPAFVQGAQITFGSGQVIDAWVRPTVVPTLEVASVGVEVADTAPFYSALDGALNAGRAIVIGVNYSDLGGEQRTRTEIRIRLPVHNFLQVVEEVALFECDGEWHHDSLKPRVVTGSLQPFLQPNEL